MPGNRTRKWILIVLSVILFIVFFRGFKITIYDNNNEMIGESFNFSQPMVYLSNLPDIFAGREIAEKYGSIIMLRQAWENLVADLPGIRAEKIGCTKRFIIVGAFSITPIGILESAFSVGTKKYFVVTSDSLPTTIVSSNDYDWYAHKLDPEDVSLNCAN